MRASNIFGLLRKSSFTPEDSCTLAAAVNAVFSKTTKRRVRAIYAKFHVSFYVYIFVVVQARKTRCFECL